MEAPVIVRDIQGAPLIPGETYELRSSGNTLVIEITPDGEHFFAVPSFFVGFFRVTHQLLRISDLAGHCEFVPAFPNGN